MKKIMTLMLSCLMILGMVACKTVGSVPTAGPFDARESVASDSRVSSVATLNPDIDKPSANIVSEALSTSLDSFTGLFYCGNAPYSQNEAGEIVPENGLGAAEFSVKKDSEQKYDRELSAFVEEVAQAIGKFELQESFYEDVPAKITLPESDYVSFWLTLGDWEPFLYVFESGDVYISPNRSNEVTRHFKASDEHQYTNLKQVISGVRAGVDALPLDYQITMFSMAPSVFKPESTGLRVMVENQGAKPVTLPRRFSVEKQENDQWKGLTYRQTATTADEVLTLEPRSRAEYSVLLTDIEGGQTRGRYRAVQTFTCATEIIHLTSEYEISTNASEISYPLPPRNNASKQGIL